MAYVDGFILMVPKENRKMYKKMAEVGKRTWLKHGAIDYQECRMDDDTKAANGSLPFAKMVKAKEGEDVWYSYIVYKTKADRNRINKLVMKEMESMYSAEDMKKMPFKMNRMAVAGFVVEVGK
jgi:uncharacterized protein YbaA (DUF1428 family)